MGLGHPKFIATALDYQLRQAQLRWIKFHETKIRKLCHILADEVVEAWTRFSAEAKTKLKHLFIAEKIGFITASGIV
ncbi:MAG: hypothetical protein Kow0042_14230 [Calditrichia bacterium]